MVKVSQLGQIWLWLGLKLGVRVVLGLRLITKDIVLGLKLIRQSDGWS